MLQSSCTPIKFTLIHGNFIIYYIQYGVSYKLPKLRHFVQALKSNFLYDIEDEEFYFLFICGCKNMLRMKKDIDK